VSHVMPVPRALEQLSCDLVWDASRLPWWRERRVRRVAGYWYDAAGAALWYQVAAFDDAEQAAYQALQRAVPG